MQRRLTVILLADVAGYSALMERDEDATLTRLKASRAAVLEPNIAAHNGRIIKHMGDGVLVEFASAVEAMRSAVELQRGMSERNADVPAGRRQAFRIGLNLGDVIVSDEDVFGDTVNVAARLHSLAACG